MLTFVRRKGLGLGSIRGLMQTLEEMGIPSQVWRNDRPPPEHKPSLVIRWGCSSTLPWDKVKILNEAKHIHRVNDKRQFSVDLAGSNLGPPSFTSLNPNDNMQLKNIYDHEYYILRPKVHSRGKNLVHCYGKNLWKHVTKAPFSSGYYIRPFIDKKEEYRAYVVGGRVVNLSRKIVEDKNKIAWNHSLGAVFENVKWGSWSEVDLSFALRTAQLSGLFYCAVDLMLDKQGNTWVIEANSAGSLPPNEDKTPSYRNRCVAKAIAWHYKRDSFSNIEGKEKEGWRSFIHPAIWKNHQLNKEVNND